MKPRKIAAHVARVAILLTAFAVSGVYPQASRQTLSSLDYIWGVAADSTDVCARLPLPWRDDCQRGAEGLRNVVLICSDSAAPHPLCIQEMRRAAELGDSLKYTVLAIDGATAVCELRKIPPGRCTDLEFSQSRLASIVARILQLAKSL